ncbi:MAG: N-acetyltransferase [Prevotellaceae bacterium]|nr:N-acetyltransferase [Prevotellaceae bacterium]
MEDDGKTIAEITYQKIADDCIIIDHTFVDYAYRGQDLGKKLVAEVVDFARREKLKITPVCSYAKAVMSRTPAYSDVLK